MKTSGGVWSSKPVLAARLALLVVAVSWTTFLVGLGRTAQFGQSWRVFLASLAFVGIFVLPIALGTLMGLRWRPFVAGLLVALLVPIVLPEVLARTQEASFKSRFSDLPAEAETVYEPRWWPYRGNVLLYDPATGIWHGDC